MKFLFTLTAKIEAFLKTNPVVKEPNEEVAEGEKVLGTVPDGLIKLHAFKKSLIAQAKTLEKEHQKTCKGDASNACKEFKLASCTLDDEIEIVNKAFWRELRNELGIESDSIGIRKGWKVVEIQESHTLEIIGIGMGIQFPNIRR